VGEVTNRLVKQLGNKEGVDQALLHRERDLIDQLNRALIDRDAAITALASPFRVIAAGRVQMNGAGGFTINEAAGCRLSVATTDLQIDFDEEQPAPLRYNVVGTRIGGSARSQFLTLYSDTACRVRLVDMGNVTESFAATQLSYAFTVETF
jgi:hypothetical protein